MDLTALCLPVVSFYIIKGCHCIHLARLKGKCSTSICADVLGCMPAQIIHVSLTCIITTQTVCPDEIDAIAPKRETAQREMERRIVAQMLTCMDDLSAPPPSANLNPTPDSQTSPESAFQPSVAEPEVMPSKHVVVIGKCKLKAKSLCKRKCCWRGCKQ